jgi:hypothetical protein
LKAFARVEADRRAYHAQPTVNTIHRSSLLVPEIEGAVARVAFLNHFLLKRGYPEVACRISGMGSDGELLVSSTFVVDEPRVYDVELSGSYGDGAVSYLVEFFSSRNLFVPFPAVMVNHVGDGFVNSVHAYNRVTNDVFDDDAVNKVHVAEASIDAVRDDARETFVVFAAGVLDVEDELCSTLVTDEGTFRSKVPVRVPRLTGREVPLRELVPDAPAVVRGSLSVEQPHQPLFFGRMLVGVRTTSGELTANHSYYDNSAVEEYWDDDRPAFRVYPLVAGLETAVTVHPVMSPGRLGITIELADGDGTPLGSFDAGVANDGTVLTIDIEEHGRRSGLPVESARTFTLSAAPLDGRTPRRINHQLIYGAERRLPVSINTSLTSPHVYQPAGRAGFTWGQLPVGPALSSDLAFVFDAPGPLGESVGTQPVTLSFYSSAGHLFDHEATLAPGGVLSFTGEEIAERAGVDGDAFLWYIARSPRADPAGVAVTCHRRSGAVAGEHSF